MNVKNRTRNATLTIDWEGKTNLPSVEIVSDLRLSFDWATWFAVQNISPLHPRISNSDSNSTNLYFRSQKARLFVPWRWGSWTFWATLIIRRTLCGDVEDPRKTFGSKFANLTSGTNLSPQLSSALHFFFFRFFWLKILLRNRVFLLLLVGSLFYQKIFFRKRNTRLYSKRLIIGLLHTHRKYS